MGHSHQHDHHGHDHDAPRPPRPGDRHRIEALWPWVREQLAEPGSVLEIGCGPLGGFVPLLRADGHRAVGVDPSAPEGPDYHQVRFEDYRPGETEPDGEAAFDAAVACLSLHHVEDLDALLAALAARLRPGGLLVVREWARELFDEPTARWCFDRLGPAPADAEAARAAEETPAWWLERHRQGWQEAGGDWADYLDAWAEEMGLMPGSELLRALDASPFETVSLTRDPYFHLALPGTTAAEEQAAVDAGAIRANGLRYVGRLA